MTNIIITQNYERMMSKRFSLVGIRKDYWTKPF